MPTGMVLSAAHHLLDVFLRETAGLIVIADEVSEPFEVRKVESEDG